MIMIYNIEVCLCKTSLNITDAHKRLKEKKILFNIIIVKVIVIFEDI